MILYALLCAPAEPKRYGADYKFRRERFEASDFDDESFEDETSEEPRRGARAPDFVRSCSALVLAMPGALARHVAPGHLHGLVLPGDIPRE